MGGRSDRHTIQQPQFTLYNASTSYQIAKQLASSLDPAVTTGWLAELAPSMALAARAIVADRGPLPAPAAVAIELSAPVHLEQRERLFAS